MLTSYVNDVNIVIELRPVIIPGSPGTRDSMPSSAAPKRTYHHGDLRQSLIEAACDHMREHSIDTLSLRALARQVGVSQTAPYRHFESKNALFAAVATWGFELMAAELRAARDASDDTEAAFIAVGLAYVEWALENPEKYQLFFDASLLDFGQYQELQQAGACAFDVLLGLIRQGQEEALFVDLPAEELAGAIWSSVHGMTSLIQKNHTRNFEPGRQDAVPTALQALNNDRRTVMELFLNGIRKPS